MSRLPSKRVTVARKWLESPPMDKSGKAIPRRLWPKHRRHCWIVRWFVIGAGGKTKRPGQTFNTRDEAEAFALEKAAEFKDAGHRREARALTLGEFIDEFAEQRTGANGERLRYSTVTLTCRALRRFAGFVGMDTRLSDITQDDVTGFSNRLIEAVRLSPNTKAKPKRLSPNTVAKIKRTLKAAFSRAQNRGLIRVNPLADCKIKSESASIRYVTPDEFASILSACAERPDALWWRTLLTTLYTAGLRIGEASALTWADVDFERGEIKVTSKRETPDTLEWAPKTTPSLRTVPIPPETVTLLTRLQEQSPDGYAYVLLPRERFEAIKAGREVGAIGEGIVPMRPYQGRFAKIVVKAAKSVPSLATRKGKPTASFHDLRRSCITNWSSFIPMQATSVLAGHSSINTTAKYYAATTEDQRERARQAACEAIRQPTDTKLTQKAIGAADEAATPETTNACANKS